MEPQDNKRLVVTKAISAHEEAEAALSDLMRKFPDPACAAMVERVQQNLRELRMAASVVNPEE